MGRRKRVYSRSVENVNKARKTLSEQREHQHAELARAELAVAALAARQHEQHMMQDEGEIELWEANVIDSGDEGDKVCDEDELTIIHISYMPIYDHVTLLNNHPHGVRRFT